MIHPGEKLSIDGKATAKRPQLLRQLAQQDNYLFKFNILHW